MHSEGGKKQFSPEIVLVLEYITDTLIRNADFAPSVSSIFHDCSEAPRFRKVRDLGADRNRSCRISHPLS